MCNSECHNLVEPKEPKTRKPKYEVHKTERLEFRLTPKAKAWILKQGGADYIERRARE